MALTQPGDVILHYSHFMAELTLIAKTLAKFGIQANTIYWMDLTFHLFKNKQITPVKRACVVILQKLLQTPTNSLVDIEALKNADQLEKNTRLSSYYRLW